jgi:hypothetical protein
MAEAPVTGVEQVDTALKLRAPFTSIEEAEIMAARLLAVWRALQPGSESIPVQSRRRQRRK